MKSVIDILLSLDGYLKISTEAQILRYFVGGYAIALSTLQLFQKFTLLIDFSFIIHHSPFIIHQMSSPKYEYQAGGSLPLTAPSYIKRQADDDFYQGLKQGEFCYVLNARQMGKSSLRVRTIARLRAESIACATIDITEIGSDEVTLEQWYAGLIDIVAHTMELTDFDINSWWDSHHSLSPVHHFAKFIEEILLVKIQQPIVIFIDETDAISRFGEDFFALIRSCYNKRPDNPAYQRLTFAILGVVSPSDLIADKKRTPFNIGRAIDLTGFRFDEARDLAQGLPAAHPETVLKIILDWTGGQPFLTQKLCQQISHLETPIPAGQESTWIERWVQDNIINHWEGKDEPPHLKHIRDRILHQGGQHSGRLLALYQKLLQTGPLPADDSREQVELRFSGLVVRRDDQLGIYNPIYAQVFDLAWVENALANLRPYADHVLAWERSEFTDDSRLLQGQALQEAQVWAKGKSLSDIDHDFLKASGELELKTQMAESIKKQRDIALNAISKRTYEWIDQLVQIPRTQEIVTEILTDNTILLDQIYALDSDITEAQREKGVSFGRVGDSWLLLGDTEKALRAYQQALEMHKQLAQADPTNVSAQRDLMVSYYKLGSIHEELQQSTLALQYYQKGLAIVEKLVAKDPRNQIFQDDLNWVQNKIKQMSEAN
jgi:tetratricopeptide (TPR) repeat protein